MPRTGRSTQSRTRSTFSLESGTVGGEFERLTRSSRFKEGEGLNGQTWRRRDLVFVENLADLSDCPRAPVALREGIRSGVCLPLTRDDRVIGTMDFFAKTGVEMPEARLDVLRTLARVASDKITQLARQGELYRIMRMIENAPLNMMYCDLDLKVQYINPASVKTLEATRSLPADQGRGDVGKSIDIFHRNPEHQRRLLADPKNLPHEAVIRLGPESLEPARDGHPRPEWPLRRADADLGGHHRSARRQAPRGRDRGRHQGAQPAPRRARPGVLEIRGCGRGARDDPRGVRLALRDLFRGRPGGPHPQVRPSTRARPARSSAGPRARGSSAKAKG